MTCNLNCAFFFLEIVACPWCEMFISVTGAVFLSTFLIKKNLKKSYFQLKNKWNGSWRTEASALEMGLIWFPKVESTVRQTPSASECLSCRWSWHCQWCQGKWTSHLGRWIFHVHWRPPRLNLSSHWLALIYVAYVDCNAIHMSKLPFSYAWAKAHTAADRQLSVCACVRIMVRDWVHVYVCICFSTSIFVRTILSFRPWEWGHFQKAKAYWPLLTASEDRLQVKTPF